MNGEKNGWPRPLALGAGALVAIGLCLAVHLKGPRLDEYWTALYTDPALPLARAWDLWSADSGHPVGYYASTRAHTSFLPQSVTLGRVFNVLPLLLFLWFAIGAGARGGASRAFGGIFAVTLLGGYVALERFADHRAFFPGLMLLAVLVMIVARALTDEGRASRAWWQAGLAMVALALFNYFTLAAGFALLGAAMAVLALSGRFGDAARLALAAIAGAAVAALSLWNASRHGFLTPAYAVGMAEYAVNIAVVGAAAVLANIAVAWFALRGGLAFLAKPLLASSLRQWRPEDRFALCLVLAVFFALAGYTLVNLVTQTMVKRQLIGLVPLVAGLIAHFATRIELKARDYAFIVVAAAVSVVASLYLLHRQPGFDRHAASLAAAQRACPTFGIVALDQTALLGPPPTRIAAHRNQALTRGYRDVADRFGLTLRDPDAPRAFDAACGGAIWMEHAWIEPAEWTASSLAGRLGFALSAAQQASARLDYSESSLLLCVPGARNACGTAN